MFLKVEGPSYWILGLLLRITSKERKSLHRERCCNRCEADTESCSRMSFTWFGINKNVILIMMTVIVRRTVFVCLTARSWSWNGTSNRYCVCQWTFG
uniref:Uncharacterized protein n=1 Tax=Helianthus annuus TaxID=4232 RepID=A0A251SWF5_HELAN